MNHSELIKTVEYCYNLLLNAKIPISENICPQIHLTHKKGYFGICMRKKKEGKYFYIIGLNTDFVATQKNAKAIEDTIIHELIHTIEGCFNHGKNFRFWANKINNLFGYNIGRFNGEV